MLIKQHIISKVADTFIAYKRNIFVKIKVNESEFQEIYKLNFLYQGSTEISFFWEGAGGWSKEGEFCQGLISCDCC